MPLKSQLLRIHHGQHPDYQRCEEIRPFYGSLYASDGRTRSDASKKYGSGGLIQGKTYMLSLTWNAPMEAFTDKEQFFHGVGVDGVYLPFHKANQFLGMEALPTFIANDVIKMPDIPRYVAEYREHLAKIFG